MQNAQNTEIQQRVINLVELYRTKVGKESQNAKDLAEEHKAQYNTEIENAWFLHEQGMDGYVPNIDIPEDIIDNIRVNEQLLGYFYKKLAGDKADALTLAAMLAEKYNDTIFTEEEEAFLEKHFKEMVNYIIQTPNNDFQAVEGYLHDTNDLFLIPAEVLELIKSRIEFPAGAKIYNPFTGLAQFANLYPQCCFLCEESFFSYNKRWNLFCDMSRETTHFVYPKIDEHKLHAWMTIALYANNIRVTQVEDNVVPSTFDAVISYIPWIPRAVPSNAHDYYLGNSGPYDEEIINKIRLSYQNLPNGGKMVMILPSEHLWKKDNFFSLETFWQQVIDEKSLKEIIQLPSVLSKNLYRDYCIVVLEKKGECIEITFTDSRFASKKSNNPFFSEILDLDAFNAMLQNNGKDPETGLCKMSRWPFADPSLLVPQVYVVEGPSGETPPAILANLCSLETTHIYDVVSDLPEDTPWVKASDLSTIYAGPLDTTLLKKANCPNNPKGWKFGKEELSWLNGATSKEMHISAYRNCKYLDGNQDAVLFRLTDDGITTAFIHAPQKAIAVAPDIHVLYPAAGVDALSLLAIINMPVVYRQLLAYHEFGFYGPYGHLHRILVPADKRIIKDAEQNICNEEKICKVYKEKFLSMKTEYINEVRMRKHDMGQYIFELFNIEDMMRYYMENRETEKDFCQEIEKLLDNFKSSLGELSDLLDNLSEESQFGEPDFFDIDGFLSQLKTRHKADGFKIEYEIDKYSIKHYYKGNDLGLLVDSKSDNLSIDAIDDSSDSINVLDDGSDSIDVFDDGSDSIDVFDADYSCLTVYGTDIEESANIDDLVCDKSSLSGTKIPLLYVSQTDMQRTVNNILDNAKKHGFTDPNRQDYEVRIHLSIDVEKNMFQIDFCNNGNPLPKGLDKMRYGLKGEKAGQTGGTGIGGHYVKAFVEHYDGDYDVFMKDGWTIIRIYLPIK